MAPTYDRNGMCDTIEAYAAKRGYPEIKCWVVTLDDGAKEYAINDGKDWLYGSPLSEAIAVHIDMMRASDRYEREDNE